MLTLPLKRTQVLLAALSTVGAVIEAGGYISGTPAVQLLYRHVLPNTVAPLIVQGTYICALAMLVESILSFLGVGLPTDVPTWGNIMAEGRLQFIQYPHTVLFPGVFLALTVLSVNMLGDGLRDTLEGKLSLTDRVFGAGARLGTTYGTTPYGMWVTSITIQNLLEHTAGGWQNDTTDPMFAEPTRSAADLIGWTLDSRPLGNPPGSNWAYSNFGCCLLGRVIEAVSGQSYADYVRTHILAPCGITAMTIAGDRAPDRQWPEAMYVGKDLENPYGMKVRRMDSHGGWLATPSDLLRFGLHVDGFPSPADILQANTVTSMTTPCVIHNTYARGWGVDSANTRQHSGLLPGTLSVLLRTAAQREWAAVINAGIVGSTLTGEFEALMWKIDALI